MAFEQIGGAERALEMTRDFTHGPLRVRPAGRVVPGAQAPHGRRSTPRSSSRARTRYYGAWALSHDAPSSPSPRAASRVAASEAFELAGEEMIQMHGGVGFTWEYDCHLFYRRAKLPRLALGTAGEWREKLVARLEKRTRPSDRLDPTARGRRWTSTTPRKKPRSAPKARAWLEKNATLRGPDDVAPTCSASARTRDAIARAKAWQAQEVRRRLGRASPGRRSSAAAASSRDRDRDLGPGGGEVQDAADDLRRSATGMLGPDDHGARHAGAEGALPRDDGARRGGLVPALQRAGRRLRPRRPAHHAR